MQKHMESDNLALAVRYVGGILSVSLAINAVSNFVVYDSKNLGRCCCCFAHDMCVG